MSDILWCVRTRHGMGIRAVPSECDDPEGFLERLIGSENMEAADPASEADVRHVRSMGGMVPPGRVMA